MPRRTKNGLPKHCCWNLDRANGKRRVRFRKGTRAYPGRDRRVTNWTLFPPPCRAIGPAA